MAPEGRFADHRQLAVAHRTAFAADRCMGQHADADAAATLRVRNAATSRGPSTDQVRYVMKPAGHGMIKPSTMGIRRLDPRIETGSRADPAVLLSVPLV